MMKIILFISISISILANVVNAAPIRYHFVGNDAGSGIDFILQVDYSQDGYYLNGDGSLAVFDTSRNTFLAEYVSGNYSLAPSTNQFQSFYGENGDTPEGIFGCVNVLNTLSICDDLDLGFGGVSSWQVGNIRTLTLGDSMASLQAEVKLQGIATVPLPASIIFMLSGLAALFTISRKKYNKSFKRDLRFATTT